MCTMAFIPLALMALQTTSQFIGRQGSEQAARQQAANNAAKMQYEAALIENERKNNAYETMVAKRSAQEKNSFEAGRLRLLGSASGVDISSGSALDMLLDNAAKGAADDFAITRQANNRDTSLLERKNLLLYNGEFGKKTAQQSSASLLDKALPFASFGKSAIGAFAS